MLIDQLMYYLVMFLVMIGVVSAGKGRKDDDKGGGGGGGYIGNDGIYVKPGSSSGGRRTGGFGSTGGTRSGSS